MESREATNYQHTKAQDSPKMNYAVDIFRRAMSKGVTYRYYGKDNKLRRPMFHRWSKEQMHGTTSVEGLMMDNIIKSTPLFDRLVEYKRKVFI